MQVNPCGAVAVAPGGMLRHEHVQQHCRLDSQQKSVRDSDVARCANNGLLQGVLDRKPVVTEQWCKSMLGHIAPDAVHVPLLASHEKVVARCERWCGHNQAVAQVNDLQDVLEEGELVSPGH